MDVHLRPATTADGPFLRLMLLEAANWLPSRQVTLERLLSDPATSHYVEGWPRPGDRGLIAEDGVGKALGATWSRFLDSSDPGYGYVADDVPELTLGVVAEARGRGIGRELLRGHATLMRAQGCRHVSLSVERANHAWHLYRSEGWRVVESERDSDTMVLDLG